MHLLATTGGEKKNNLGPLFIYLVCRYEKRSI